MTSLPTGQEPGLPRGSRRPGPPGPSRCPHSPARGRRPRLRGRSAAAAERRSGLRVRASSPVSESLQRAEKGQPQGWRAERRPVEGANKADVALASAFGGWTGSCSRRTLGALRRPRGSRPGPGARGLLLSKTEGAAGRGEAQAAAPPWAPVLRAPASPAAAAGRGTAPSPAPARPRCALLARAASPKRPCAATAPGSGTRPPAPHLRWRRRPASQQPRPGPISVTGTWQSDVRSDVRGEWPARRPLCQAASRALCAPWPQACAVGGRPTCPATCRDPAWPAGLGDAAGVGVLARGRSGPPCPGAGGPRRAHFSTAETHSVFSQDRPRVCRLAKLIPEKWGCPGSPVDNPR